MEFEGEGIDGMWKERWGIGIDLCAIVAVERGPINHSAQDFRAVLVHRDGTRIAVDALFQKVICELSAMLSGPAHKCRLLGDE